MISRHNRSPDPGETHLYKGTKPCALRVVSNTVGSALFLGLRHNAGSRAQQVRVDSPRKYKYVRGSIISACSTAVRVHDHTQQPQCKYSYSEVQVRQPETAVGLWLVGFGSSFRFDPGALRNYLVDIAFATISWYHRSLRRLDKAPSAMRQ